MILLVVAEEFDAGEVLADRTVARVDGTPRAAAALDAREVDAVVLSATPSEALPLLRRLHGGEFGDPRVPVVVRTAEPLPEAFPLRPFDEVVSPREEGATGEAVARASAVAAYLDAVTDLYDACEERATGGVTDPLVEGADVERLRDEADERLDDLLSDPEVLAALLWTPGESPDA
ncbi:MAG: hypothetical protein ABEJ04_01605 [Halobacteriaceae archaeon]